MKFHFLPLALSVAVLSPAAAKTTIEASQHQCRVLPAVVSKAMKPGAVTLVYQQFEIGPKGSLALVHVSSVRKGQVQVQSAPFTVDVFAASSDRPHSGYQLVNSTQYRDYNVPFKVSLQYLKPRLKQGPMVVVDNNGYRSYDVHLLTFPNGLGAKAVVQDFPGPIAFGAPDKRGLVTIKETHPSYSQVASVMDEDRITPYRWNGQRFVAQRSYVIPKPYLVIAGMSKNRAELEKLQGQIGSSYKGGVMETSAFPRLPAHRYVFVLDRCRTSKEADKALAYWKDYLSNSGAEAQKIKLEVRRGS